MIPRYTRAEMGRVWSDANKYARWLDVEIAATETLAEAGQPEGYTGWMMVILANEFWKEQVSAVPP